jgi:hypothetical protein
MDFSINNSEIEKSFDRIATDLFTKNALFINNKEFQITEIEFYYYYYLIHEDNYTHDHNRDEGEWRFHNQGLDITFQANEDQVGGILIRGIKVDGEYINGPRKIIQKIFENFNKVSFNNTMILRGIERSPNDIIKTFRHLPNKDQDPIFHNKLYRYIINLDELEISATEKEKIKMHSIII